MRQLPRSMKKGFTLTEALMGALLFGLIGALMLLFFVQGAGLWSLVTISSDLRSTGRGSLDYMQRELAQATRGSLAFPSPNLSIPPAPNNNSLTFALPADLDNNGTIVDAVGNIEWDIGNKVTYQYDPAAKQLLRVQAGNRHVIANNAASVKFEDASTDPALAANEVKITLTLEKYTVQKRLLSITLVSIVKLRN